MSPPSATRNSELTVNLQSLSTPCSLRLIPSTQTPQKTPLSTALLFLSACLLRPIHDGYWVIVWQQACLQRRSLAKADCCLHDSGFQRQMHTELLGFKIPFSYYPPIAYFLSGWFNILRFADACRIHLNPLSYIIQTTRGDLHKSWSSLL
jgi:hypothetical protein